MILDAFSLNRAHHTSRECNRKNYKKDGYRRVSRRFFSPPFFFVNRIQPFCEKEKNRSSLFCFLRSYPSIKKQKGRANLYSPLAKSLLHLPRNHKIRARSNGNRIVFSLQSKTLRFSGSEARLHYPF